MKRLKNKFILWICACFSLTLLFLSFTFVQAAYAEEIKTVYEEFPEKEDTATQPLQDTEQKEQEALPDNQTTNQALEIGFFDYVKVIFMLFFVILLLYLFLRFLNKKSNITSGKELIQNLGGVSLGSNKNVQILKIGQKLYLVGVGENVNLLKEITEKEEVDALVTLYNERVTNMFSTESTWVSKIFQFKERASQKRQISEPVESDFKELFEKQLIDLGEQKKEVFELLGKNHEDKQR